MFLLKKSTSALIKIKASPRLRVEGFPKRLYPLKDVCFSQSAGMPEGDYAYVASIFANCDFCFMGCSKRDCS
jgi:hypothetical protein